MGAFDDSVSVSMSVGTFQMHEVDISKNYGHGTVPVPGRESHTADLAEFDLYVKMMEVQDRSMDDLPWDHYDDGDGENDEDDRHCNDVKEEDEEKKEIHDGMKPIGMNIDFNDLKINDPVESYEPGDDSKTGIQNNYTNTNNNHKSHYSFNPKFWSYIRSILSEAQPVGFSELSDPNATEIKGPLDANAFIKKVIAISSINPIQPAVLAEDGGFDEMEVLVELLYATCVGLVAMTFAPECVQCGSATVDVDMLGKVPSRSKCQGCNEMNVHDSLVGFVEFLCSLFCCIFCAFCLEIFNYYFLILF